MKCFEIIMFYGHSALHYNNLGETSNGLGDHHFLSACWDLDWGPVMHIIKSVAFG